MKKILNFIKYHNAFNFIIGAVFLSTASAFAASPELRKDAAGMLISQRETIRSIDNRAIISMDMEQFNPALQIMEIAEDEHYYYVRYRYQTLAIQEYVWREAAEENTLKVSKEALAEKDLGLFVAKQLGEVIDYERSYLKEVQARERATGITNKIATIEYSGLVGRFFNPEKKIFPGYKPVVEESESLPPQTASAEPQSVFISEPQSGLPQPSKNNEVPIPNPALAQDPAFLREMLRQVVREYLASRESAQMPVDTVPAAPTIAPASGAAATPITTDAATSSTDTSLSEPPSANAANQQ